MVKRAGGASRAALTVACPLRAWKVKGILIRSADSHMITDLMDTAQRCRRGPRPNPFGRHGNRQPVTIIGEAAALLAEAQWGGQAIFLQPTALPAPASALRSHQQQSKRGNAMSTTRVTIILMIGFLIGMNALGCGKKVIQTDALLGTTTESQSTAGGSGTDAGGWREDNLQGGQAMEGAADEIVTASGIVMNRENFINMDIFFEFDSSALSAEARDILKAKAEWMARHPELAIVVEGHCDNRGTTEYNLALGERRAESVKAFLMDTGVEELRVRTISYGEERPLVAGDNEASWSKNRRAHFEFD